MPSDFFNRSYQLYKKQTDQIAQWLLDTAERWGYQLETQPSSGSNTKRPTPTAIPPPTSGRLKGKARKEARDRLNIKQRSPSTPTTLSFRIRLPQFTELAHAIMDNGKGRVVVPNTIIQLLQQTIEMRKRVSGYYKMQAASTSSNSFIEEGNANHLYFIQKLEEVLEILGSRPALSSKRLDGLQGGATGNTEGPNSTRFTDLDNRFSALQVEQPIEVESGGKPPATASGLGRSEQRTLSREVVCDTEESDDSYFAIFCLFDDLQQIRMSLQQTWEDYKSGKIDLITASAVTNTAFDIARNFDEEFCQMFPELSGTPSFKNVSQIFYFSICLANGIDINFREHPDDAFNYQLADVGLFLYIPTCNFLEAFCRVIQPREIPQAKKGYYGTYNPKSDRTKMSLRERIAEDKIILLEILPEFCILGQSRVEGLGFDELTKGLGVMYATKQIPLWLAFAAQVFLDINHVLRDQVGGGLLELKSAGRAARSSLTLALDTPSHSVVWPKSNDQFLRNTLAFVDQWIMDDMVDKMRRVLLRSVFEPEPYYLLSRHPLLCGSMLFSVTLMMREAGTALAMAWGSILYVAHLYNALRQSGILDVPWPDMELFVSICTPKSVFVGDYPTTIEDCLKRYELAMGASVENYAKDRTGSARRKGKGKVIYNKKGPRDWSPKSRVIDVFKKRYLEKDLVTWTAHDVEVILDETSFPDYLQPPRNKSQPLNTSQLLALLKYAITSESPGLHYDFASMHFRCLDLLRALRTELDENLKQCFGPTYLEHEDQLASIPGYIIMASATAKLARGPLGKPSGDKIETATFVRAGDVMKKFIESTTVS
jgi:hypothetical protein